MLVVEIDSSLACAARSGLVGPVIPTSHSITIRENDMTSPLFMATRKRRIHLLLLAVLITGCLAAIGPLVRAPVVAQPLCLDGKVWNAEAEECVALGDQQLAEEPQPTAIPAPTETTPPTEIPAPTQPIAPTDAPPSTVTSVVTDMPTPSATSVATSIASDAGDLRVRDATVGFVIYSRGCPSGFDPRTADQATLANTCSSFVGDVLFSLTVNGEVVGSATSPEGVGGAVFGLVPPGDFAISQSVPPGFSGPAVVVCEQAGDGADGYTKYTFSQDGGAFVLPDVQPDTDWYCRSFLVAKPNAEITVYVFGCPENYAIYTKGPDELKADCTGQFEGTEFVLLHPSDGVSHATTSSSSTASFVNVSAGQVRLQEAMPNGYGVPVVFCQVSGPAGQTTEQYDKYNVGNDASIGLGMDELEFVGCDFFQAPGGQPVDTSNGLKNQGFPVQFGPNTAPAAASPANQDPPLGTPVADEARIPDGTPSASGLQALGFPPGFAPGDANLDLAPGTSYINILNVTCPDNPDIDNLPLTCQQVGAGTGFVVTVNNDTIGAATTGPDGFVQFADVPAGDLVVAAFLQPGYGAPIVSCTVVNMPSGQIVRDRGNERYVASPGGSVVIPDIRPDEGVYCIWFNMPTHATGAIDVIAWGCPEGYDISTKGPDDLIGDCGQKLAGVEFQLQHPTDGFSVQATAGLRSTAYFRTINPGQVTLRESIPGEYGMPVVFCEALGPDGQTIDQYDRYDVATNASVQLGMDELDRFRCDFFQVPGVQPINNQDLGPSSQFDPASATFVAVASPADPALP